MTGVVIVPSRERPGSIAELVDAFAHTGARSNVLLVVAVDDDDPQLAAYEALDSGPFVLDVAPRTRIGPRVNRLAVEASDAAWVGFMGDDHRPRTRGWWRLIDDALSPSDGPGVVYGDDLFQGRNLASAAFISGELIARLGYMHPPGLWHLYLDNAWMEIGRATRLVYDSRLIIEHLHPVAGKAEWDDSYRANNSSETYKHDGAEFARWLAEDWPAAQERLRASAGRVAS